MGELKGLYISEDLHRQIKIMAISQGKTVKDLVEEIFKKEIEDNEKDTDKQRDFRENGKR